MKLPKKSTVLCSLGCLGVIGTGITTFIATRKSEETLNNDELTTKEKLMKLAPKFSIPIGIGGATIACIIGNNIYNRKQIKSLATAYISLAELFNAYRNEVLKEENGKELDEKYYTNAFSTAKLQVDPEGINDELILVRDKYSNEYIETTMNDLLKTFIKMIHYYDERDELSCNDYRQFLGLDWHPELEGIGWSRESGMSIPDFTIEPCYDDAYSETPIYEIYIDQYDPEILPTSPDKH